MPLPLIFRGKHGRIALRWILAIAAAGLVVLGWLILRHAQPSAEPPPSSLYEGTEPTAADVRLAERVSVEDSEQEHAALPGRRAVRPPEPPDDKVPDGPASPSVADGEFDPSRPQAWPASMRAELERLESPAVPIKDRLRALEDLGRSGDARSVAILQALAGKETYLNYAAVEALRHARGPEAAAFVGEKLAHADSRVIVAAVRSLAAMEGGGSLPRIVATLEANRARPDGHHDVIRTACVETLGALRASAALPALRTELTRAVAELGYEYASSVVGAMVAINDPAAAPALQDHLTRLRAEHAAMTDNPQGQRYLEEKIREAEDALGRLGQ